MYIFFLSSLLLLTGCSITQETPLKSSITLAKEYTQVQNIQDNNPWWEELNDPQLNTLIETALKNNRELKVAIENVNAASALLQQSASLKEIQADTTASVSRSFQSNIDDTNLFSFGVGASYELDLWGRLDALESASRFDYNASQEDLNAIAITISAEVATVLYRLLEQHQQLLLLQKQLNINEKYLQLLISKFNISNVKAADILQQRQALEALQGERELTQALFLEYQTLLALLLGTDISNLYVDLQQPFHKISVYTKIDSTNLLERPDVKAAYLRVQASSERVSSAISNTYPRISITAALSSSSTEVKDLFKDWLSSLAANLTAPLLDGGRREAEVAQQRANSRAALYAYEQTLLKALKEVQDTQNNLIHQERYLQSIEKQRSLSHASMRRIQEQYIYGNGDFLRLLTAQLNYEKLERSYLSAHRELIEKNIALHRAVASKINPLANSGEIK